MGLRVNEQLVEFPAILDSLFHKVVNTTSNSIRVVGSHKMEQDSGSKNFICPKGMNSGCFKFQISQNVAISMLSLEYL